MQVSSPPRLYLGSFNSEQFWRGKNLSHLPAIADQQANQIVKVMDELQFVFCTSSDDLLLTHLPLDKSYQSYLAQLGFLFSCNDRPLKSETTTDTKLSDQGICETLLISASEDSYYQDLLDSQSQISPYAIEPFTESLCQRYGLQCPGLNFEIVQQVNSKVFSHHLAKQLFPETVGEVVYSADELEVVGSRFLQKSPCLIKDEFGVSGKGNILISSEQILRRIATYVSKQERSGKHTRFLLEPLLDKAIDFSCQLEITATGNTKILSIQKMNNSGFAFSSIQTADILFQETLDTVGYFEQVKAIANELYQVGYCGPVCLDSMQLQSGAIVPVVEINARKSMGLINHYVDRFLAQFSLQGELMFFSLSLSQPIAFSEMLRQMEKGEILFSQEKPWGILPLASNAFNVNCQPWSETANQKKYQGRLYASVIFNNDEEKDQIIRKMDAIFTNLDIKRLI